MTNESLSIRITKMLFEAEPELLRCDAGATARAAYATADVLGAVLATVLQTQGFPTYEATLKQMVARAHESALATVNKAEGEAVHATKH